MDQTDFAIAMVSSVLIIMVIFLFILLKIFGKKKTKWPIVTLLPETIKKEPHQTEKFVIRPQEIEGLEREFQLARDLQKRESVNEIIMENPKEEPLNEIIMENPKEEPMNGSTRPIIEESVTLHIIKSIEENDKLKLEDILIEKRDEKTQKKVKKTSSRILEKANKLKEREIHKKSPGKKPARNNTGKDHVPEQVSKVDEEESPGKKPARRKTGIDHVPEQVSKVDEDESPGKKPARRKTGIDHAPEQVSKVDEDESPGKKPARRKTGIDHAPEQVSKVSEGKSTGKKPGKKMNLKKRMQAIVNENPASGGL